eukprot:m.42624 g.42624  ORF g.42624 m.42624 type:complete len:373 (-) comp10715_c0_seq1:324-1442(-)
MQNPTRFGTKANILTGITFPCLVRLLWRFRHHVCWRFYWFRITFLVLMSLFNSFLGLLQQAVYGGRVAATSIPPRPVFVLGHPRTGTTLLHNLLAADHEHFLAPTTLQAGFPAASLLIAPIKFLFRGVIDETRPMDNMALSLDTPQEDELAYNVLSGGLSMYAPLAFMSAEPEFRKYFDMQDVPKQDRQTYVNTMLNFLKTVSLSSNGRRLVLKSPTHTAKIQLILQLFPDAQFIYIHRDPYRVYASAKHMAESTYCFSDLTCPTEEQTNEFILNQFVTLHNRYVEDRKLIPDGNLVEVSFDELAQDPVSCLKRVYTTLGWPHFEASKKHLAMHCDQISGYKRNAFQALDPQLAQVVADRWQAAFHEYGYNM